MSQGKSLPSPVSPYLSLRWRSVAVGSGLIAIAALTTLVILTSTTDADSLSSIALILAILAFVVQIIVFTADFALNSRRDKEASELNANTLALLAKIEEKANSTNQAVDGQMTKLIDKLILGEKYASKAGYSDTPETEARRDLIADLRKSVNVVPTEVVRRGVPARRRAEWLGVWPVQTDVDRLAMENIELLTLDELDVLVEFARDIRDSFEHGFPEGLISELIDDEHVLQKLVHKRFVRHTEGASEEPDYFLTGRGYACIRLFLAPNPIPERVEKVMPWLPGIRDQLRGRNPFSQTFSA